MKKLLLLFLSGNLFCMVINGKNASKEDRAIDETKGASEEVAIKEKPCRCYCSDLCGPRDATKPGDKPFYDKKYNKCFCQQRDKDNYLKNKCDLKKPTEPTTCCSKEKSAGCCAKKSR